MMKTSFGSATPVARRRATAATQHAYDCKVNAAKSALPERGGRSIDDKTWRCATCHCFGILNEAVA